MEIAARNAALSCNRSALNANGHQNQSFNSINMFAMQSISALTSLTMFMMRMTNFFSFVKIAIIPAKTVLGLIKINAPIAVKIIYVVQLKTEFPT